MTPEEFEAAYLATDDPRAHSGFHGDAARWEAVRRPIVEAIDHAGSFLDVGCANGLLLESLVAWSPFPLEPYGLDFAPRLVELARERIGADRIWLGDARTWEPPRRFEFVHVRHELGLLPLEWGRRLIVSSDGSYRRAESPKAEPVGERLRELGFPVAGELYRRDDEQLVELAVAWVDA